MHIIREPMSKDALRELAKERFGDMVKAVVDCERNIMAIGGELHADEEQMLLENGSKQEMLWGINLYPDDTSENWIEFDSMINVRPNQHNRSRGVENTQTQEIITNIVTSLIL